MQPGVLPPEVLAFEQVIAGALSEQNAARQSSEQTIAQTRAQHADAYISSLTLLLQAQERPKPIREFCAVMIRQSLQPSTVSQALAATNASGAVQANGRSSPASSSPASSKDLLGRLSPQTLSLLKGALLRLLEAEQEAVVRTKVVDVIGVLCSRILAEGGWPEFIPAFLAAARSPLPMHRLSVVDCIDRLSKDTDVAVLTPHLSVVRAVLIDSLTSKDAVLRLAALRATISFLLCLDTSELTAMRDAVPLMFAALERAYTERTDDSNDELLTAGISVLSELASSKAAILRPHLSPIIRLMTVMVKDERLEEGGRRSAMEFLIALAEDGKGMVRKVGEFAATVIPLSFALLLELDDDISAWSARDDDDDEDDDSGQENYRMGAESAGRLAQALQGKIYTTTAMPLVTAHMRHEEWRHRHAALIVLTKMAESIDATLQPLLPTLVPVVTPYTRDPHPRVAHAALHCLAQLTVSYSPSFQETYHSTVLSAIIDLLQPDSHHRLITSACVGLIEFCREVESGVIQQYASAVLVRLELLIQHPSLAVKESVISVISALSLAMGDAFTPFYPKFYPGVKHIVLTCTAADVAALRGKAIECIGTIAEAVGPALFGPEAHSIMETLVGIKTSELPSDDPTLSYLVAAEARIAKCIGSAFTPYLPYVVPPLLASAAITDEYAVLGEDDDSGITERPGYETTAVEIRGGGSMRLTVNTALFEEKAMALNMLYQYAEQLKGAFLPYVQATADVIIPNLGYKFHESVRIAAVSSCPALIRCTADGVTDEKEREGAVRALWSRMLPELLECTKKELHLDNLCGILDALGDAVKEMGCSMADAQLDVLAKELRSMSAESVSRTEKREERRLQPDFDEEEEAVLTEENESEDEFLGYVYQCIAALIATNSAAFLPHYHAHLHPFFAPLLQHAAEALVVTALCVIAQVVNDLPLPPALQQAYCDLLFPRALQHALAPTLDLRQSAVFAIGACAHCLGERFAPVMGEAIRVLTAAITEEGSKAEEMAPATDNAVGALDKVVVACRAVIGEEQRKALMTIWVDALPCIGDVAEAIQVHDRLLTYIDQDDVAILGARGERVEKLVLTMASLLESEYIGEDAPPRIAALLTRWKGRMSPTDWEALLAKMDDEDRQSVDKVMQAAH